MTLLFVALSVLGSTDRPLSSALITTVYFGTGTFVVLRWGLLSYAMGFFVSDLLLKVPATVDSSAWYFGNMLLLFAIPLGLATWALYTCLQGGSGQTVCRAHVNHPSLRRRARPNEVFLLVGQRDRDASRNHAFEKAGSCRPAVRARAEGAW